MFNPPGCSHYATPLLSRNTFNDNGLQQQPIGSTPREGCSLQGERLQSAKKHAPATGVKLNRGRESLRGVRRSREADPRTIVLPTP
jgi:hypothetical protein